MCCFTPQHPSLALCFPTTPTHPTSQGPRLHPLWLLSALPASPIHFLGASLPGPLVSSCSPGHSAAHVPSDRTLQPPSQPFPSVMSTSVNATATYHLPKPKQGCHTWLALPCRAHLPSGPSKSCECCVHVSSDLSHCHPLPAGPLQEPPPYWPPCFYHPLGPAGLSGDQVKCPPALGPLHMCLLHLEQVYPQSSLPTDILLVSALMPFL